MKKKKLILHIGRHKTGTTALQHFFTQKTDFLAKRGILYPKTGRISPQGVLQAAHHSLSQSLHFKPRSEVQKLFDNISQEAEHFHTILLSSEDFQNQKDFALMEEIFAPYDLTIVGYLREGLGYNLSGFAQRIHNSSEIFNIRQYIQRQNIRISSFVNNWSQLASKSIFRLYDRDSLKNRDIITDFLDIIGLDDFEYVEIENEARSSNPSLSGNLLALKMLLNLMGQSLIAPYSAFETAAYLDPTFNGKIYISDRVAKELRELDNYNATIKAMFPKMNEPSFTKGSKIFNLTRWDKDMELISSIPALSFAKVLRLGAMGEVLSKHGLSFDLTEGDFPDAELINSINLPNKPQSLAIQQRALEAIKDASFARKARAEAENNAAKAVEQARIAKLRLSEASDKLKFRIKHLEKNNSKVTTLLSTTKRDNEKALKTFNKTIKKLTKERNDLSSKLKTVGKKTADDTKILQEQIEKIKNERNELSSKLKKAGKKAADDTKILQEQIEKIKNERNDLSSKLKTVGKNAATGTKTLQKQIEKIKKERNELSSKLKKAGKKASDDTRILQEQIEKLRTERDTAHLRLQEMDI